MLILSIWLTWALFQVKIYIKTRFFPYILGYNSLWSSFSFLLSLISRGLCKLKDLLRRRLLLLLLTVWALISQLCTKICFLCFVWPNIWWILCWLVCECFATTASLLIDCTWSRPWLWSFIRKRFSNTYLLLINCETVLAQRIRVKSFEGLIIDFCLFFMKLISFAYNSGLERLYRLTLSSWWCNWIYCLLLLRRYVSLIIQIDFNLELAFCWSLSHNLVWVSWEWISKRIRWTWSDT